MIRILAAVTLMLLTLVGREAAWAQGVTAQCITNVAAQGTGDAITSGPLPCGTTTNMVIMTLAAPNASGTPTYQPIGSPALPITRANGAVLFPGDLATGSVALLTSTGSSWVLLNPASLASGASVTVTNNSQLQAISTSAATTVTRMGFAAAGDSTQLVYAASGSACSLAAGVGDGGSQVPSADGKCWLASLPPVLDPRDWGFAVDGKTQFVQRYQQNLPVNFYVSKTVTDGDANGNTCLLIANPCATITHAVYSASRFAYFGGQAIVNIGAGTWAESVSVNGSLMNNMNFTIAPNISYTAPVTNSPMLLFYGAGGSTIWNGDATGACGTLIASYGAFVGVANMKMQGTRVGGCRSTLFAQLQGHIHVFDNMEFGDADVEIMHAENAGTDIEIWKSFTVSGSAVHLMSAGNAASIISSAGVITMVGTPNFSSNTLYSDWGMIQFNVAPVYSGAYSGTPFTIRGNAVLQLTGTTDITTLGGTGTGLLLEGGRVRGNNVFPPCIGGAVGCAVVVAPTGLGTGGSPSVVFASGSDSYSGQVILTTGNAGVGSSGQFHVSFPWRQGASGVGRCVLGFSTAGVGFAIGATTTISPDSGSGTTPPDQVWYWNNAGAALTANATYNFKYVCGS